MLGAPRKRNVFLKEVGEGSSNISKVLDTAWKLRTESERASNVFRRPQCWNVMNCADFIRVGTNPLRVGEVSEDCDLLTSEMAFGGIQLKAGASEKGYNFREVFDVDSK